MNVENKTQTDYLLEKKHKYSTYFNQEHHLIIDLINKSSV